MYTDFGSEAMSVDEGIMTAVARDCRVGEAR
jgi:hypothetical protein